LIDMAKKISGAISGPLTLTPSDNPLTITGTGSVASMGANNDGIDGAAGTAWSIINKGTVSSEEGWAISLAGAGALDNSGMISGQLGGFETGGGGAVTNKGTIKGTGAGQDAIDLHGGGSITNKAGGLIQAGSRGVAITIDGGSGTVTNSGTISGSLSSGVFLLDGGSVTNKAGGIIRAEARSVAVDIENASGTVTNHGKIIGGLGGGVSLNAGGVVTNGADGVISGGALGAGVEIGGGSGTVMNNGEITGTAAAVFIFDGGSVTNTGTIKANGGLISDGVRLGIDDEGQISVVTNEKGGLISGNGNGVETVAGSGIVTNAGTISGGTHSVLFDPGTSDNRLVIVPGAVFKGAADATGATNSTIELAKGSGAISGIGNSQFLGFDTLVDDNAAKWTLKGVSTIATVLNDGKLELSGGLTVSSAIDPDSTGVFKLDGGSTLEVAAAIGSGSRMSFASGSELVIDHFGLFGQNVGTSNYTGSLLEMFGGSTIDLKDFGFAGLESSFSSSSGLLQLTNGASQAATLDFKTSNLGAGTFHFASDESGGVLIKHF
jgi:hypothetical protein